MEIQGYKDGAVLVFRKGNDEMRYDFRDKGFYKTNKVSRTLRKVNTAYTFFKDISLDDLVFDTPAYTELVNLVNKGETRCKNIGTLLDRLEKYQELEKYTLSGIKFSELDTFTVPLSTFAKPVREFMALSRADFSSKKSSSDYRWIGRYHKYVDILENNGWEKSYLKKKREGENEIMVNEQLFINLCTFINTNYHNDLEVYRLWIKMADSYNGDIDTFRELLVDYKLEYKALFDYLVNTHRYEALDFNEATTFLRDYLKMCVDLGKRSYDKYPKNLRLSHDLVLRNYNSRGKSYDDVKFATVVNNELAWSKGNYQILVPQVSADVKREATQLDHCVASYIDRILDGTTQIVFMRQSEKAWDTSDLTKQMEADLGIESTDIVTNELPLIEKIPSLITVEIRNGGIIQARGYKNRVPTNDEKIWLSKYAKEKGLSVPTNLKPEDLTTAENVVN